MKTQVIPSFVLIPYNKYNLYFFSNNYLFSFVFIPHKDTIYIFLTICNLHLQLAIEKSLDFYSWHVNSDSNTPGRRNLNICGPTELAKMLSIGAQESAKNKKASFVSKLSHQTK